MFFTKKNKITPKKLYELSNKFVDDSSFFLRVGAELEFYFSNRPDKFLLEEITQKIKKFNAYGLESEVDDNQYEIKFEPSYYTLKLADSISGVKNLLSEISNSQNNKISFAAKPYPDKAGSAMHIHISLHNKEGDNLLEKEGDSDNDKTLYIINGLLELLPSSMKFFAPNKNDYDRFIEDKKTPSTISWGGNNRTVALRLPETTATPQNRRIEHRVPCSSADPYKVLYAIVKAVKIGLEEKKLPKFDKIHGDAYLDQYQQQSLPKTLKQAKKIVGDFF